MLESATHCLLNVLAIPDVGLWSVFLVSFLSATLLPMGSEPAVFAIIKANGVPFWSVILVATIGNTLGGMVDYWMGYRARNMLSAERTKYCFVWVERFGAKTMLLGWVPVIGDPICTLAGWLKIPFWPSVFYMVLGKLLRYITITWALMEIPDGVWKQIANWF
jgi:membrane protein YqaA with SNARE-associated domain